MTHIDFNGKIKHVIYVLVEHFCLNMPTAVIFDHCSHGHWCAANGP